MTESAPETPRARGWVGILLALMAFLLVPAIPVAGALLPVTNGYLLLLPAFAVCTLLGWWAGGRGGLALFWILLAAVTVLEGRSEWGAYDTLLRSWAIILAGAFGVLALVDARRPLFARALSATGMTLVAGLGITTVLRAPPGVIDRIVIQEHQQQNAQTLARLQTIPPETFGWWSRLASTAPGAPSPTDMVSESLDAATRAGVAVFPALLALQSLAALALAWALYHRIGRTRIGPPLGALRDFRFSDQLVWGLIVGLAVLLLPSISPARAAALRMLRSFGVNLIVFFLALYAVRGLGVISSLMPRRTLSIAVGVGLVLVVLPPTMVLAMEGFLSLLAGAGLLGLADTWFDWRRLARTSP